MRGQLKEEKGMCWKGGQFGREGVACATPSAVAVAVCLFKFFVYLDGFFVVLLLGLFCCLRLVSYSSSSYSFFSSSSPFFTLPPVHLHFVCLLCQPNIVFVFCCNIFSVLWLWLGAPACNMRQSIVWGPWTTFCTPCSQLWLFIHIEWVYSHSSNYFNLTNSLNSSITYYEYSLTLCAWIPVNVLKTLMNTLISNVCSWSWIYRLRCENTLVSNSFTNIYEWSECTHMQTNNCWHAMNYYILIAWFTGTHTNSHRFTLIQLFKYASIQSIHCNFPLLFAPLKLTNFIVIHSRSQVGGVAGTRGKCCKCAPHVASVASVASVLRVRCFPFYSPVVVAVFFISSFFRLFALSCAN